MKLYIDGVLAASQAQAGSIATNSNPLVLGNQSGYSEYFGGTADEFRIWNVARTQSQIQNNMNKELNPTTQTGLVSYYTADQGIAGGSNTGLTTVIDQAGTNNGSLSNFSLSGATSNFVTQYSSLIGLPVSLASFTAKKNGNTVLLNWSTASEQNSKDFVIQYSSDDLNWNDIAVIKAAENNTTVRDYSYVHTAPNNGLNYYRLSETDIDGRISLSDTRFVRFIFNKAVLVILKNPVMNGALQITLDKATMLSVYGSDGVLFWQQKLDAGVKTIDVIFYAKGLYFIKTEDTVKKIVIQ